MSIFVGLVFYNLKFQLQASPSPIPQTSQSVQFEGSAHLSTIMEKQEVVQLEHVETKQSDSPTGDKLEVKQTLQHVDLENRYAFKGDDSDGKIDWTIRKIFASAFLAMLYTGTISSQPVSAPIK